MAATARARLRFPIWEDRHRGPADTKRMLLAQQHAAQHARYQQDYRGMEALIVERGAYGCGRRGLVEDRFVTHTARTASNRNDEDVVLNVFLMRR